MCAHTWTVTHRNTHTHTAVIFQWKKGSKSSEMGKKKKLTLFLASKHGSALRATLNFSCKVWCVCACVCACPHACLCVTERWQWTNLYPVKRLLRWQSGEHYCHTIRRLLKITLCVPKWFICINKCYLLLSLHLLKRDNLLMHTEHKIKTQHSLFRRKQLRPC